MIFGVVSGQSFLHLFVFMHFFFCIEGFDLYVVEFVTCF